MTINLINGTAMSGNIDTGWKQLHSGKERPSVYSLQIEWKSVTGTLDGTVKVYKSNSYAASNKPTTLMATYNVTTATNATDCEDLVIEAPMEFIKVVYTKNNVTNGTLTAVLTAEIDDAD
jgi:hypothetical protein